ncbi:uncharacterized protein PGTG_03598 [Puccinia graminis f. sp. tritici CRL 75-36-700-3]|uniref:Uncharacterized protein n=1 Tax=Puccinia graminis f. sp. tritici (strain CRL 75-36-700-3 / race SCCL) TaxID=418459 RepID=E3K017_PUCGT|nr:uncharacterized protein PGTG_03598 [Puccinia graminis f. sp. tritici CRL 75-36-700-3]EFP77642.1 hypothetical protein PGTG_03598 [Puccinia graminis f. sp. tritici CRL 75-36-700-3]
MREADTGAVSGLQAVSGEALNPVANASRLKSHSTTILRLDFWQMGIDTLVFRISFEFNGARPKSTFLIFSVLHDRHPANRLLLTISIFQGPRGPPVPRTSASFSRFQVQRSPTLGTEPATTACTSFNRRTCINKL